MSNSEIERPDEEILEPQDALILREDFVDRFEQGAIQVRRFLIACIRMTHARQWVNHGTLDKPQIQLQGPGAEALMAPLGVGYAEAPTRRRVNFVEEDGTTWYAYEVEGWLNWDRMKRRGYYKAAATSLDKFFSAKPGFNPMRDYVDVENKAMTHWLATALARLCGLRNPDPGLLEAGGIKIGEIPRIDYSGTKSMEQAEGVISEPQAKRLYAIYKNQNISEQVFKDRLIVMGALDKDNKPSTRAVKRKDYEALVRWVEAGGQDEPREPGQEG